MRISTKLWINISLPIGTTLIIILIMISAIRFTGEAERKNRFAISLRSDMFELDQRTYYYFLYPEARAKKEWFEIFNSLAADVEAAKFGSSEQDAIVERIHRNLMQMKEIFTKRIALDELPADGTDPALVREKQDRLSAQVLTRAGYISSDAYQLYEISSAESRKYSSWANTLILLLLLVSLLITLGTLIPINRTIARGLSRLTAGAGIIGFGNLDHKIALHTADEFGELSRAFDDMTRHLKTVTVSRDELAKEVAERKRTEEALERSEAILKQAGQMAHLGAWEIEFADHSNINENPLHWSDEVYRIFGYEPGSVTVTNDLFFERVHPDDREPVKQAVATALANRTPYSIEHRIIRPDGSERIVYEHAEIFFENGGRPVRIIGAVQDITEQKRSEEALKQNQRFLETIIENAPACVKLVAADGTVSKMNSAGLKILEADSLERIQGKSIFPIVSNRYREEFIRLTRDVFHGRPGTLEFEAVSLKGKTLWLNTNAVPLHDNAGNISALLGITVDVTGRKHAEEERERLVVKLRELAVESERNRAQLEAVFQALSDGVVIFDMEGRAIFVNEAEARINGYPDAGAMMRDLAYFADVYELSEPGGQRVPVAEWPVSRVLKGESVVNWELKGRRRDTGQEWFFSFSGQPVRDEQGRQILALVVTRDITEGKLRYEEFKKISRQNELILESAGEGIFGLDLTGKVTFVNAVAAHMLGYHRMELMGSHSHTAWHYKKADGSPYPSRECPIYAAYKEGAVHSGEEIFWKKDGSALPVDFTSRPIYEEEKITGAVVIYRDITDRKRREEELRRLLVELERSNKELEQFAYVASHDLQEPLRMVASYVQLLEKKYKGRLDEKADKYIFFAVDGVVRMQKLIDGLLAYSRVARGGEFDRVDTNRAFSSALSNLAVAIHESGALVTKDDLPVVFGDEMQLSQVFQNLIVNAIKFRKQDVRPMVHVSAKQERQEWIFSVRDNGIGIDPQYYNKIFLIFQRLHTREKYPGTGIGLALCKRIVERHHGRIWFESTPGGGTTFFFTIPQKMRNYGNSPDHDQSGSRLILGGDRNEKRIRQDH